MNDTLRFEVSLSCWFSVTAHYKTVVEVDREEWEEMSNEMREQYIKEECERILNEQVAVDWKPLNI